MKKKYLLAPVLGAFIYTNCIAAEKSAFGAGDVNSQTPYGLTESEKVLLKNRAQVDKLSQNISTLESRSDSVEERVEGVRSVLDGTNERLNELDRRLSLLEGNGESNGTSITQQVEQIRAYIDESRNVNENNKKILKELSSIIESINRNYVSKSKFAKLEKRMAQLEKTKSLKKTKSDNKSDSKDTSLSNKSGKFLLENGLKLYKQKKYDDASKYFLASASKKHKPAQCNYMLGEVAYKQKNWSEAISYYKESAGLYDKAKVNPSIMPRLLYHTAISFDKLHDTKSANDFYKALKINYPESKEAKASPDRK